MGDLWQDVRYAARTLRRAPVFTMVAVVTIGLGVGANTAIFSIVEQVLLRPLPYRDADRLVVVGGQLRGVGTQDLTASSPEFRDYGERATTLDGLAACWLIDANLTSGVEPERVRTAAITSNFFSLLGRTPALGRDFRPEDAAGEIGYVAILSYDTWQRLFQGDPTVVGKTVRLDDDPFSVIGVMPQGFEHPGESQTDRVSIWIVVDLRAGNRFDQRGFRPLTLVGRLKPGATLASSRVEFESIASALRGEYPNVYPEESGWTVQVASLTERILGDVRPTLLVLFAAVGLVLLTACTNVASLLLTRGQGRGRELAMRVALGSSRYRIVRQLLTETLVLMVGGAAAGIALAAAGLHLLRGPMIEAMPRLGQANLDWRVLAFALLVSGLAGVAAGLFPAIQASRLHPQELLREARDGGARGRRVRGVLATAQVAVSLMLVVGAGLLTRSLVHVLRTDPGFRAEGLLAVQTWLPIPNDPANGRFMTLPDRAGFVERALEKLQDNPGVTDVAMTSRIPLRGLQGIGFLIEGAERPQGGSLPTAEFRQVSPNYFEVMGIPLLRGRTFTEGDDANSPPVVVVDRRMADLWFDGNAVGQRIRVGGGGAPVEIIGVVGDVREEALDIADRAHIYVTFRQMVGLNISFVLKATGRPESLSGFVREAIRRVDPDQPVFGVAPMEAVIAETLGRERLLTALLNLFATLGLTLAAVGVYGVVSHAVRQRYREIGIRMALGAAPGSVMRLVLRDGLWVSGSGILVGLVAALAASGILSAVLHGIRQRDPVTFLVAACFSLAVTLAASALPARLAARVQPVDSIRQDGG